MTQFITFLLQNFSLTFFLVGLIVSAGSIVISSKKADKAYIVEALITWFIFFSIGVSYLYNGVVHTFSEKCPIYWPGLIAHFSRGWLC